MNQRVETPEVSLESGHLKAEGREGKGTGKTLLLEEKRQLIGHKAFPQANICTSREGHPACTFSCGAFVSESKKRLALFCYQHS